MQRWLLSVSGTVRSILLQMTLTESLLGIFEYFIMQQRDFPLGINKSLFRPIKPVLE